MKKIGILGGGQLGKMFMENASSYPYEIHFMDCSTDAPVSHITDNYRIGNILDYEDVLSFGLEMDVISIEIENVHVEALHELQSRGKTVIPDPKCLDIITDKGLQKQFYEKLGLPSTRYEIHDQWEELKTDLKFPIFQKYRKGGYDGKGVQHVAKREELQNLVKTPSVLEEAADIDYEISVQVFKSQAGELVTYPVVRFVADEHLNLVDYLIFPTGMEEKFWAEAKEIAESVASNLSGAGVFSVEMFKTKDGKILINETAPRVHNSGHSTIEASSSSQFDQMLRILAGLPLAQVTEHRLSAMWNILGPPEVHGKYIIHGLDAILNAENTYLHWYRKSESKPGRKMGHITFLADSEEELVNKINFAKANLKIVSL